MRKLALALVLCTLVAAPAAAGSLALMYGTWDTDTAEEDQGGAVKLDIDLGRSLDLEIRASFFDSFSQIDGGQVYEIEATPIDLGIQQEFLPDGQFHPYVGVGVSYVLIEPNEPPGLQVPSRPRSQEEIGWYGVLGVELGAGRNFAVMAEALYRDASGEIRGRGLGTEPGRDFEVDFGGVSAYVGVALTW